MLELVGYMSVRRIEHWWALLIGTIEGLVERARDAGHLRWDVSWTDIPFLLRSVVGMPRWVAGVRSDDNEVERLLTVFIDGLRADAQHSEVSGAAPVLDI